MLARLVFGGFFSLYFRGGWERKEGEREEGNVMPSQGVGRRNVQAGF